jgi:hypothetical protein
MALPKPALYTLLVAAGIVGGIIGASLFRRGAGEGEKAGPGAGTLAIPRTHAGAPAGLPVADARDPFSVLADAIANRNRDSRAEALRHLAMRLVGEDVNRALEVAAKVPDANDRIEFMRALFAAWAAKDPRAALEYLKANFKPGAVQSEGLDAAIETWAATSPRDAWQWLDANISGPLKEQGQAALVMGWARNDPQGAAAWFAGTGSTSQNTLNALVTTWADLNPRAAAAWVESLTNAENKTLGRVVLASEWALQNPAEAAAYFTPMMTEPRVAIDLSGALVNSWAATDPAAAAAWIEKLPPGNIREAAAGTLATIWAGSDITAAVKWSEKLADPGMRAQVIDHLGTTWGAIEPQKALAWLATLPAGESRTEATLGAFNSWAATDTPGMRDWISKQPPGPVSDLARVSLGEVLTEADPPAAMQMALGIGDTAQRADSIVKFFREWNRTDHAAAGAWLNNNRSGMTLDVQKKLDAELKRAVPR